MGHKFGGEHERCFSFILHRRIHCVEFRHFFLGCEQRDEHECEYGDDGEIGLVFFAVPMAHLLVHFCLRDLPVIVRTKIHICWLEGGRTCFTNRDSIKISRNGM